MKELDNPQDQRVYDVERIKERARYDEMAQIEFENKRKLKLSERIIIGCLIALGIGIALSVFSDFSNGFLFLNFL